MNETRHRLWDTRFTAANFVVQLVALFVAGYWAFWRYGTIETPTHQPRGNVVAKVDLPGGKSAQPLVCEVLGSYEIKNVGTGTFKIKDVRWALYKMKKIDLKDADHATGVFANDRMAGVPPLLTGVIADSSVDIGSQLNSSWSLGWQVRDNPAAKDRTQIAFVVWPNLTEPADVEKGCGTDAVAARNCPYVFLANGYPCETTPREKIFQ